MRRLVPAVLVAVAALAVLTPLATARSELHFSVREKVVSFDEIDDGVRLGVELFAADDPTNQVGTGDVVCREQPSGKERCRALFSFNGKVGGSGDVQINGNLGRGDHQLNITGGTGDFAGVAGKLVLGRYRLHFDLVV